MTLGIRNRPTNRLTESATQSRAPQLPASQPGSIWPEPRPLDLETLDGDEILFQRYRLKRLTKKVSLDDWPKEHGRATTLEVSYATLVQNGKVLETFDDGLYHPMGNSIDFGLFPLLGVHAKQLVVAQTIWRGGAYWIVNFAPRAQVIYHSSEWSVGTDEISAVDLDHDGVEEIFQRVIAFYSLQDKLAIAQIPLPEVVFKYDAQAARYLPANSRHKDYLMRDIEEFKATISEPSKYNFNHLACVLAVTLRLIYAGEEKKGWEFFDKVYQLPDKEEIKARVLALLKDEPVHRFIYRQK
jgi:hypothetical protein